MVLKKINKLLVYLIILGILNGCSTQFIKQDCESYDPKKLKLNDTPHEFVVITQNKCNPSGAYFEAGYLYKFEVTVKNIIEDGRIKENPQFSKKPLEEDGFNAKHLNCLYRAILAFGQPFRPIPSSEANWFELIGTIGHKNDSFFSIYYYIKEEIPYQAESSGELFCLVNDFPLKYGNNHGSFRVQVTRVPAINK